MQKTGVDRRMAEILSRFARGSAARSIVSFMVLSAFLSMWMSNTASVAIMIPIAIAAAQQQEVLREKLKILILGVAWAGSIGGIGSAIGTPANMLAIALLNEYAGQSLQFADWFRFGLPMVLMLIPILWIYLMYFARPQKLEHGLSCLMEQDQNSDGRGSRVLIIFGATVTLWLTESWHGIPSSVAALLGAFGLFVSGILGKDDFNKISWNSLLTFGGGLAMGRLLVSSGISQFLAEQLAVLQNFPQVLVLFSISLLTVCLGAFISNTACAAMIIPVAIPLADVLGIDIMILTSLVAIASSIDFAFVVGTPPTMLAYSTGVFTTREIFRIGIVLNLIAVLVLNFLVIPLWKFF